MNFTWLSSDEFFKYLGQDVSISAEFLKKNFVIPNNFVQLATAGLRRASGSLLGRVCLVKTLAASKLVYKFSLLPPPPVMCLLILIDSCMILYGEMVDTVFPKELWNNQ